MKGYKQRSLFEYGLISILYFLTASLFIGSAEAAKTRTLDCEVDKGVVLSREANRCVVACKDTSGKVKVKATIKEDGKVVKESTYTYQCPKKGPPVKKCGNGQRDPGEECDPGQPGKRGNRTLCLGSEQACTEDCRCVSVTEDQCGSPLLPFTGAKIGNCPTCCGTGGTGPHFGFVCSSIEIVFHPPSSSGLGCRCTGDCSKCNCVAEGCPTYIRTCSDENRS